MEYRHRFVLMDKVKLANLIKELKVIGCCHVCIVRYLGVTDSQGYRDKEGIEKLVSSVDNHIINDAQVTENQANGSDIKHRKPNSCVACLGLVQHGVEDEWSSKIALEILGNGIEAVSYCPSLILPVSLQIRAYSIWFHLQKKFGEFLTPINDLKPDGTNLKASWKWIMSNSLRAKVDPKSEWGNEGNVKVEITVEYEGEHIECQPMRDYILQKTKSNSKKKGKAVEDVVSRSSVSSLFKSIEADEFIRHFQCPPSIPTQSIRLGIVRCHHEPMFLAGRYCKYSRELSQTPWFIDNIRKTEESVEELMSVHIQSMLGATQSKFSSSGREDVDVRMLGLGRPFVFEVIEPKRTLFSAESIKSLQNQINSGTKLISVRDLQLIDKKDHTFLKTGEETKTKVYCALCVLPTRPITRQDLEILNSYPLPMTLKQKTPVRVLHRRSLATRERNVLEMKAVEIPDDPHMFKLMVRTDAGTYVKEFVHGDFGRTLPNITTILRTEADILALDVTEVALDWPPALD